MSLQFIPSSGYPPPALFYSKLEVQGTKFVYRPGCFTSLPLICEWWYYYQFLLPEVVEKFSINIYEPAPPTGPTRQPLETLGNFRGWYIRTEQLQHNCSWTVKHQCVDLLAEGLWEELLDDEQPDITVMDWFEDSRLDVCVYELHVWLLAADRHTIIAQHHVAPRTSGRGPPGRWVQVSHVFRQYGPGVRFVHFLHKTKNRMEAGGLRRTRVTDSSVSVQFRE
ncbi:Non-specific cytotoxic cell receptor protein 1 like protein [Myotis brandtii]|uniref:F-box only protein 50 n=1 Tax=Myotis brandtii TaxID=109478 RepID=S7NQS8_MYOBR|nr:Non-specific cytotoxic cell receptor protein 1 like protein [Myotis brandtii]